MPAGCLDAYKPAYPASSVPPVRLPCKEQDAAPYPYVRYHQGRHRWARIIRALLLVTVAEGRITPLWHAIACEIMDRARTGAGCWASYETIAQSVRDGVPGVRPGMRCSTKSVGRCVKALSQMGLLWVVRHYEWRAGGTVPSTNTIHLLDPTAHDGVIGMREVRDGGHRAGAKSPKKLKGPAGRVNNLIDKKSLSCAVSDGDGYANAQRQLRVLRGMGIKMPELPPPPPYSSMLPRPRTTGLNPRGTWEPLGGQGGG
jgi:hypothetical protein